MLKLKPQYFSPLMSRADSMEKTLMLGKTEGRRRRGRQRLDGTTGSTDMSLNKVQEMVKVRETWYVQSMGSQRFGHDGVTERQHRFFSWGPSLKSLLNLLQHYFCSTFCFLWPRGRWNLSSPTRTPWIGRWSPNHWTTREVLESSFLSWEQVEEDHCRPFRKSLL